MGYTLLSSIQNLILRWYSWNSEASTLFHKQNSKYLRQSGFKLPNRSTLVPVSTSCRTGAACLKPSLQHEPWRACYAAGRQSGGFPAESSCFSVGEFLKQFWPWFFYLKGYIFALANEPFSLNVYIYIHIIYIIYYQISEGSIVGRCSMLPSGVKVDSKLLNGWQSYHPYSKISAVHLWTTFKDSAAA